MQRNHITLHILKNHPSSCVSAAIPAGSDCFLSQAFGEDIAILAGDALLSLSFEYIARETQNVPPERVLRVCYPSSASMQIAV